LDLPNEDPQWTKKMFILTGDEGIPEVSDDYVANKKRIWAQFSGRDRLCKKIHLS